MSNELFEGIPFVVAFIVVAYFGIRFTVIARNAYKKAKATEQAPPPAAEPVIWRDPGGVEHLDLAAGPGGREALPVPPFRFLEERANGSQPCVSVRDARGRRWRLKWGPEVRCETFAMRLAWACGYFAEVTHFVPSGRIEGAGPLTRASSVIEPSGAFIDARFELDDAAVDKHFGGEGWSWNDNPFIGTRELAGLRIVSMLLSNWDNKDRRDASRGPNTAIYVTEGPHGRREAQYMIADWGGSMGRWGQTVLTRGRWDPDGFAAQTPQFVTAVADGFVQFGYTGQRTGDSRGHIRVEDVAWLCRWLRRLTERQFLVALYASGATDAEAASFTASLRARVQQLADVADARRDRRRVAV